MSYLETIEYRILPRYAYKIQRNCSGCKGKSNYINTGNFRVNANGNRIDVWLIYQCEKCRHTYNLTVHERVKPTEIPEDNYKRFLANDEELALAYGMNKGLLAKNKAFISDEDMEYELQAVISDEEILHSGNSRLHEDIFTEIQIILQNPYEIKIRSDKLASEILQISRSKAKKMLDIGSVKIVQNNK